MRRVADGSLTNLSDSTQEPLKPLFGSKGAPPYYDPNDLHVHVWKRGKLGIEDNPKIPTYAKGKLSVKSCIYCKLCHMIKDPFQSSIGSNRDFVEDIILIKNVNEYNDCYSPIERDYIATPLVIERIIPTTPIKTIDYNNSKLFHEKEGIFDDYVEIE
jgi:hypothetical protein